MFKMNQKGDVWVSTILYTLIGLAIIGSLIAVIQPRISESENKRIADQTVQSLNVLDDTILRARESTGTRLEYKLNLDKGNLIIDGVNESIYWQADLSSPQSQENMTINLSEGRMQALTVKSGALWNIKFTLNYKAYGINITVNEKDDIKTLTPSSMPYSIWITNRGIQGTENRTQQIDFSVD